MGCRSTSTASVEPTWPELELTEMGHLTSVAVSGNIWAAGVPELEDLDLAARRGFRRVIDISVPSRGPAYPIGPACRDLGLTYIPIGLTDSLADGTSLPRDQDVDRFLEALDEGSAGPDLVFCENGSRSAMFIAIHRVLSQGVPLDIALADARRAGMKPDGPGDFVRSQVARRQAG